MQTKRLIFVFVVIILLAIAVYFLIGKKEPALIATLALSLFVAVSTIISNASLASIKLKQDKEIYQYTLSNQNCTDFLRNYNRAMEFTNKLSKKYGDRDSKFWLPEEIIEYNNTITDFNVAMDQMYVTLPDSSYGEFIDKVEFGKRPIKDYGEDILVAMRKANHPETKYNKREDIRLLYYK